MSEENDRTEALIHQGPHEQLMGESLESRPLNAQAVSVQEILGVGLGEPGLSPGEAPVHHAPGTLEVGREGLRDARHRFHEHFLIASIPHDLHEATHRTSRRVVRQHAVFSEQPAGFVARAVSKPTGEQPDSL